MTLDILLQIESPQIDGMIPEESSPTEVIVGEDGLPLGAVIPSLTEILSSTTVSGTAAATDEVSGTEAVSGSLPAMVAPQVAPVSGGAVFRPVSDEGVR